MKRLLFLMKLQPGEMPRQFAKRVWQSLKDRNLVDEQGKLVLPQSPEPPQREVEFEVVIPLPKELYPEEKQETKQDNVEYIQVVGYPQPPQKQDKTGK